MTVTFVQRLASMV